MAALESTPLNLRSPLGRWVRRTVLPRLDVTTRDRCAPPLRVLRTRLPASHRAVRCSVRAGDIEISAFVLKSYYRDPNISPRDAAVRVRRELKPFRLIAASGLTAGDLRVVRLLAARTREPAALAVEWVPGTNLAALLKRAASRSRPRGRAFTAAARGLESAAGLLARLHALDEPPIAVWHSSLRHYPYKLLHALAADEVISERRFMKLSAELGELGDILADPAPRLVHGDANPTNFLVPPEGGIVAIDLERAGACDPALDMGFLAADAIHLTRQYGGPPSLANRLVETLRSAYLDSGGIDAGPRREGLFLAMGLWRIARNGWLTLRHRKWLQAVSARVLRSAVRGIAAEPAAWNG